MRLRPLDARPSATPGATASGTSASASSATRSESTLPAAASSRAARAGRGTPRRAERRASRRPHEARLPELDVAPPLRAAPEGPAAGAAAERVGVHGDVEDASATLSAAWPHPHLTYRTSSRPVCAASSAASTRAASRPPRRAHFANPRNDFWRLLHDGGFTPRLLRPAGAVRAARARLRRHERRVPHDARLGRPAARRLRRRRGSSGSPASCGRARSRSSARRPTAARSASAPSSGRSRARSARPALFVLPSTSPANAAVPYAERLRWFRRSTSWLDAGAARRGPRARRRPAERVLLDAVRHPVDGEPGGSTPGGGVIGGESDEAGAPARAARGDRPRGVELGPLVWTRDARLRLARPPAPPARALPPRPRRPRTRPRRRSTSRRRA